MSEEQQPSTQADVDFDHYVEEGLHLFGQGRVEAALHLWREAQRLKPDHGGVGEFIAHAEAHYLSASAPRPIPSDEMAPPPALQTEVAETAPAPALPTEDLGAAMIGAPQTEKKAERVRLLLQSAGDDVRPLLTSLPLLEEEDDPEGTLAVCERILALSSGHAVALDHRQRARERLLGTYLEELSPLDRAPTLNIEKADVDWDAIDGFPQIMTTRIDGRTPVRELLLLSGIPRFEAARTLVSMLRAEAITFTGAG